MPFYTLFNNIFNNVSTKLKTFNIQDLPENVDRGCEECFIHQLVNNKENIIGYVSEETKELTLFENYEIDTNKDTYIAAFDPIDGTSNFCSNISVGSIYGIYKYCRIQRKILDIVEAGYCLYGIKNIMVHTFDGKVFMRELSLSNKVPTEIHFNNIKDKKKIYSINQSYEYEPEITYLLRNYRANNYSLRWVGTMVADAHRILLNDGIFYYPFSTRHKKGKIRMLYESIPFSYIFKLAGGIGLNSGNVNMLEMIQYLNIDNPHKTSSVILASNNEYEKMIKMLEMYELNKY